MIDRSVPPAGVVVGVDGNPTTLRAVGWAAREANRRGLPLDLLQVLPPSHRPDDELYAPTGRASSLLEQARRIAAADVPELSIRSSVVDGVAGPALVATAQRAHLLVLGSRTFDSAFDLTLGRTLVHAMAQATCPLVVVPPRWDPGVRHVGAVVVGVDGSAESQGAVAFAVDVADRWGVAVSAVAVASRRETEDEGAARGRVLAEARGGMLARHPGVRLEEVLARGTPSEELLRQARGDAALVVVGSRGRGALAGTLVGSTSQAAVRAAPCPVAVLSSRAAARWSSSEGAWAEEGV